MLCQQHTLKGSPIRVGFFFEAKFGKSCIKAIAEIAYLSCNKGVGYRITEFCAYKFESFKTSLVQFMQKRFIGGMYPAIFVAFFDAFSITSLKRSLVLKW